MQNHIYVSTYHFEFSRSGFPRSEDQRVGIQKFLLQFFT